MSEPLGGCNDHHMVSSVYCTDNPLPTLETVSEEARKTNGESNDHLSDYYFRDSFDHSSSESGFTSNVIENRLGSHLLHRQTYTSDNISSLAMHSMANNSALIQQQNASNSAKNVKKFSLIQAFVPSFFFVVVVLAVSAVYILESDSDMFSTMKNWPEMICLRYQYYQPLKEFLAKKFGAIFWFVLVKPNGDGGSDRSADDGYYPRAVSYAEGRELGGNDSQMTLTLTLPITRQM